MAHQLFGVFTVILVINQLQCANIDYDNPVASTNYGQIRGKQYMLATTGTTSSRRVVAFIGVPYARPPIGYDRFKPPYPPEPWAGETKDCTNNRVMCPQVEQRFNFQPQQQITESEDCLYLNIYVPVATTIGFAQNMPVLVYFHGGEFKYGGKDLFKPDFVLENSMVGNSPGVIVITVNYRLGVLGFLSTDDINNPGNNGIRDQVQALRWISENIGSFNGNPANVTIMGHDAGAVSVSMHILNQDSWPYFSAAVSVGGSVFSPWAIKDNPIDQARMFGSFFGCDLETGRMAECLRNQDVQALLGKSRERDIDRNVQTFWFRPVIDRNTSTAIIKDYPVSLYQSGRYKQCPYIVGFTKDEGSLEFYLQYDKLVNKRSVEEKIAYMIRPFLKDWADEDIIASAIKFQYFSRNVSRNSMSTQYGGSYVGSNPRLNPGLINNRQPSPYQNQGGSQYGRTNPMGLVEQEENRALIDIMSDFMYIAPMDYAARLHSNLGGQVWMFVMEYEGTKSFGPIQQNAAQVSRSSYGVTHMDDLFYIFPNDYIPDASPVGNPAERQVANTYANLVSELVKQNRIPAYNSYTWQQYTAQTPNYLIWLRNAQNPAGHAARTPSDGYRTANADFFNGFIYELQERTRRYPTPFPFREYKGYQAATWSLAGFIIILIIVLIAIIAVLLVRRKKNNELKLVRKNDKEMEERFNTT